MLRTMGMVGLIIAVIALVSPVSFAAARGQAGKGAVKGTELKPLDPQVPLGGQTSAPAYLKFSIDVMLGLEGTTHGEVRTVETDFASKDFIMDVVMKFEKGDNEFIAGLGDDTRDGNWITDSFCMKWTQRGSTLLTSKNKEVKGADRLDAAGINLIRIEHKGDVLTFTIAKRDGEAGPFKTVVTKTFADFKKSASFLSDKNAAIFFGGDGTVMSVALSVEGKMADPGTPAVDPKAAAEMEKTPLTSLAGAAGLPSWLSGTPNVVTDNQGVADGEVRTREADLIEKDFICDLLFTLEKDVKGGGPLIGLGENGRDGAWILNSAYIKVHGVNEKGKCVLGLGKMRDERSLGSIGDSVGPHLMRIEKHGAALTIGVCADYKDKYVPTFAKTIPDIKRAAPFLTKLNSSLFFQGGAATRLLAMRLMVDGKVAAGATTPVAKNGEDDAAIDKMPLVSLAGQAGLPPWLKANARALADDEGIRGGELRSVDHDLISKDFTFDLLYEFKENENAHILIGLGENGRNGGWILNSVLAHVTGPASDGQIMFNPSSERIDQPFIGHTAKATGPHMFRLQKRGNTLTMAICADYKDKFEATFSKTIPDLAAVAKFLNKTNSTVFVMGDCTLKAARLVVNGKAAEGGSAVTSTNGARETATATGIEDKAPLISLAGQSGMPPWLKGNKDALAGPQGVDRGELRTVAHDLIKHDFTLDVLYQTKEDSPATLIGIGQNGRNGGWILNSVLALVHGPADNGKVSLLLPDDQFNKPEIGKLGKETGPYLFRMQKRGRTLTFAVDSKYDGKKFNPEFSRSIPDLTTIAPFLTAQNSNLFIEVHTAIKAVRLIVDGKAAVGGQIASASGVGTVKPETAVGGAAVNPGGTALKGEEHLIPLSGPKLPAYFTQQRGLKYAEGVLVLDGQHVRTIRTDYIAKDFTFDVLYRIAPGEHEPLVVGIGENGREGAWITNSVAGVLHGPAGDGLAELMISKASSSDLGKSGKGAGPVMFRLQKRGNALTMAVCPDYKGTFEGALSRTIPDVAAVAPFLTGKNSFLFFSGKATIEKVRLVVAGETTESADVVLGVPKRVVAGRLLKLKMGAAAGATYAIETAPKGLTLSASGDLAWMPGADQQGTHEVRIKFIKAKETLIVAGEVEVVSAEDAKAVNGDLAKVESLYRLAVEGEHYQYTTGLDGKSMLLLDGDSLRRLGRDGITVLETLKLPAKYKKIGERETYFVALSDEKKSLDIIDKTTLAVKKRIQMEYRNRWDLAMHPSKPLCYVTVEKDLEGARDVVLIVDETNGDVFEPENFVGHWIKIAPDGQKAYTGYTDIYEKGSRLLVNPGNVQLVPEFGSIDVLYVWDISTNKPRCIGMKDSPGLDGHGLALSADGKRLSYLSHTGYPLYSHNIPAFDPTNFEKRPVTYPTKDNKAESRDLAYHPWLEIAAAPSEDGAVCFDRESGEVLKGLLNLNSPPLGEVKATHVYFSADGRNLLIECDNGADRFLRKVKLNLTAAQIERMQTLEKEGKQLPKPNVPRSGLPKV